MKQGVIVQIFKRYVKRRAPTSATLSPDTSSVRPYLTKTARDEDIRDGRYKTYNEHAGKEGGK